MATKSLNTILDDTFGKEGSTNRANFKDQAYSYYFGEILRERRKELKMSQEDLAMKIGKKRPYISRIENGEDIRLSNFALVANALGLSIHLLPQ